MANLEVLRFWETSEENNIAGLLLEQNSIIYHSKVMLTLTVIC